MGSTGLLTAAIIIDKKQIKNNNPIIIMFLLLFIDGKYTLFGLSLWGAICLNKIFPN